MTYRLRIRDLPESERPRERLLKYGAKMLSNAELLAILLATGQGNLSAVGLGQYILQQLSQNQQEPLDILRSIHPQELIAFKGIGPAKTTTILAAVELGKRVYQTRPLEKVTIDSPDAAAIALSNDLMWQDQEHFAIVMLDVKNRILATKVLTVGTATETLIHPREIFRETIKQGATRLIIAHNHPSGGLDPSPEDIQLTELLLQGAQYLQIPILDHLILGQGEHQSLRQCTDLWERFPQGD